MLTSSSLQEGGGGGQVDLLFQHFEVAAGLFLFLYLFKSVYTRLSREKILKVKGIRYVYHKWSHFISSPQWQAVCCIT